MKATLTANLFDIVEFYRLCRKQNMWTDMLEMDLCYILTGWAD